MLRGLIGPSSTNLGPSGFTKHDPGLVQSMLVQKVKHTIRCALMSSRRKLSCAKCFDALCFCYSPVHQMQQYYRIGVLDNCAGEWTSLMDCLMLKTKSNRYEILETHEKERTHIWKFRTPEEVSARWREIYGDLDDLNLVHLKIIRCTFLLRQFLPPVAINSYNSYSTSL